MAKEKNAPSPRIEIVNEREEGNHFFLFFFLLLLLAKVQSIVVSISVPFYLKFKTQGPPLFSLYSRSGVALFFFSQLANNKDVFFTIKSIESVSVDAKKGNWFFFSPSNVQWKYEWNKVRTQVQPLHSWFLPILSHPRPPAPLYNLIPVVEPSSFFHSLLPVHSFPFFSILLFFSFLFQFLNLQLGTSEDQSSIDAYSHTKCTSPD